MRTRSRGLVTSLSLLTLLACGDSGPAGTPQDLSGTYNLVSYAQGVGTVTPVPGATGTVTLTATTYTFSVTIPITNPPVVINDQGTYTAVGTATSGTWTQESTVSTLQSSGTYEWNAGTQRLTLDTTVQGVRSVIQVEKV